MPAPKHTNALIHASSPYLKQHAHNPVNWLEWSDDLPELAKKEDKLLLISIGYSSCHWCHVMEHECFEKEDTAAIMNEHFICVKIDREERPDIDQIYMDALQLLTGRGGWPLNVFTLPDGRPLHGGTYFPKKEWERVLLSLHNFYHDKREEAYEFATNLSNGIKKLDQFVPETTERDLYPVMRNLLHKWKQQFDLQWGGYNWAPKFPLPNQWEMFMGIHQLSGEEIFKEASVKTLHKMYEGGIFDHLAGGFARYSTDAFWKVPHFEKMLYDNAQLMQTYAFAFHLYQETLFLKVCEKIHAFLKNDMQAPEGVWYAALDADSEGVEGKYYVWQQEELSDLLQDKAPLFYDYFSILPQGNWEEEFNILYRTESVKTLQSRHQLTEDQIEKEMETCRKILLLERNKRIAPGLDDKIICSWNALMVKGYARAYQHTGIKNYLQEAETAIDFLLSQMVKDNQVYRIYKEKKISIPAFAEDYACLIDALIALFEAGAGDHYLIKSQQLMEHCLQYFYDEPSALFFFNATNQKVLVSRKIEVNDDVIPSSNSILAHCLYRLSFYFGRNDYEERCKKMQSSVAAKMEKFPNGFSNWMQLIAMQQKGFLQVIVSGPQAEEWIVEIRSALPYHAVALVLPASDVIPLFQGKQNKNQENTLWICRDKTCGLPVHTLQAALSQLK